MITGEHGNMEFEIEFNKEVQNLRIVIRYNLCMYECFINNDSKMSDNKIFENHNIIFNTKTLFNILSDSFVSEDKINIKCSEFNDESHNVNAIFMTIKCNCKYIEDMMELCIPCKVKLDSVAKRIGDNFLSSYQPVYRDAQSMFHFRESKLKVDPKIIQEYYSNSNNQMLIRSDYLINLFGAWYGRAKY
jgi:hypothetical protein